MQVPRCAVPSKDGVAPDAGERDPPPAAEVTWLILLSGKVQRPLPVRRVDSAPDVEPACRLKAQTVGESRTPRSIYDLDLK